VRKADGKKAADEKGIVPLSEKTGTGSTGEVLTYSLNQLSKKIGICSETGNKAENRERRPNKSISEPKLESTRTHT